MALPAVIESQAVPASVLLVEPEPALLELLRQTLLVEGYRILATTSSSDALWMAERDHIDLVLADLHVPGMSGIDLVIGVRRSNPDVIRVLMTGTPSLATAVRAINEAGVHRYLTKPWQPADLRQMIREALAARLEIGARAMRFAASVDDLSPRLAQTLDALMTGASEKQIALQLGISHHTAHQYVKALFRRFGVSSRAELMARVLRR